MLLNVMKSTTSSFISKDTISLNKAGWPTLLRSAYNEHQQGKASGDLGM